LLLITIFNIDYFWS